MLRHDLEAIDLEDRVGLEPDVSRSSDRCCPPGRLPAGQQCTAILHVWLLDNPESLVMDQPEDNPDNAARAERIVQVGAVRAERQPLFATHNANIAVFGGAEWTGVCSASEGGTEMPVGEQGSIDAPVIRDRVACIPEGDRDAVMQRKENYRFDDR